MKPETPDLSEAPGKSAKILLIACYLLVGIVFWSLTAVYVVALTKPNDLSLYPAVVLCFISGLIMHRLYRACVSAPRGLSPRQILGLAYTMLFLGIAGLTLFVFFERDISLLAAGLSGLGIGIRYVCSPKKQN